MLNMVGNSSAPRSVPVERGQGGFGKNNEKRKPEEKGATMKTK
jgi:hypothetical protein